MIDEHTGNKIVSPLDLPDKQELAEIKDVLKSITHTLTLMESEWESIKAELKREGVI